MGGRGTSSGLNSGTTAQILITPPNGNMVFSDTDTQGYHQLYNGRQYFMNQNLTIDQQLATANYLSNTPENGSLYSMSQNMNQALATGQQLTANQQYVYDNLNSAMHNLGYNLTLTRYDHASTVNNLLTQAGYSGDINSYTPSQLNNMLSGIKYSESKPLSTSYNDFAKAPQSSANVFKSRQVKITYKAKASAKAMMPGNGPGGALGEIILQDTKASGGKNTFKIVGVNATGNKARRQGTQNYTVNQLELVVEVG